MDLIPKQFSANDHYWKRAGTEASKALYSKSKEEITNLAKLQLQQRKAYLQSLIDEANTIETALNSINE